MNRKSYSIWITVFTALTLVLMSGSGAVAQTAGPQSAVGTAASTPLSTGFTYQGQLKKGDAPVSGDCSMAFRLYDRASSGNQVGNPITPTVAISNSLFTVSLDFGASAFVGEARWLGIQVRCPGDAAYADLGRQLITAAPYSLYSTSTGALQGRAIADANPATNQVLKWNGSAWVPANDETSGGPGNSWSLTGNAGTNPLVNFLGTTDNVSLTLRVNNAVALRLMPNATSPNLVGGYDGNAVTPGVMGAMIGGGGSITFSNRVLTHFGTIAGGQGNTVGGIEATVGGGFGNTANGQNATVSGGWGNLASNWHSTVGGGLANTACGGQVTIGGGQSNVASGDRATIGGGYSNTITSNDATIGGGFVNYAGGPYAVIGGGEHISVTGQVATVAGGSWITATGDYAAVGGGANNLASGDWSAIGGGGYNTASADSFIGGGWGNTASGWESAIGGGWANTASYTGTTIAGGYENLANGWCAAVGGGHWNVATNMNAFVGGGVNNTASGSGAFVGGGMLNIASGEAASVGGGVHNQASGYAAVVGGGGGYVYTNTASGDWSVIGGGALNTASGARAVIGGGWQNYATYTGTTVAGGQFNQATIDYATVGGGFANQAPGYASTIAGGYTNVTIGAGATVGGGVENSANGDYAAIGGGESNLVEATHGTIAGGDNITVTGDYAAVGGGAHNLASGYAAVIGGGGGSVYTNTASGDWSVIGGGYDNTASNGAATVGGGRSNTVSGDSSTIGGGFRNTAEGDLSAIGGGGYNTASGGSSTVGGGWFNTASNGAATVGGGNGNTANGGYATVGGGNDNQAAGLESTIGGGTEINITGRAGTVAGGSGITVTGNYATVPGGYHNTAGGDFSFAAGRRAKADHQGTFVWADSTDADFSSTGIDQFRVRANGGVRMYTGGNSSYFESSGGNHANSTLVLYNIGGGSAAYLVGVGTYPLAEFDQTGSGRVLDLQNGGDDNGNGGGDFIAAYDNDASDLQFRVASNGEVRSDVGFNTPAADMAEMLPAVAGLEPGDVLIVGDDGTLTRSTTAYQASVVGVYSTQPGFVGGSPVEGPITGTIPLAVVGVVPVKVSGDNGTIQPGDLLVASSVPGHAMKAGANPQVGTVIGKALEKFDASRGTGMIKMLVTLQ